jgi:hypothetical protein
MIRFTMTVMLLVCCIFVSGCANQMATCETFSKNLKAYNRLIRWQEVESAGMVYLEPALRETFMKSAAGMKKRGVTITDYRILASECLQGNKSAEAIAEFDYYIQPSVRIKTLSYRQLWNFMENSENNGWKLNSGLPAFE